jgi:hypothetical protein
MMTTEKPEDSEIISELRERLAVLEAGHGRNRSRIKLSMATLVFSVIVFGLPVAKFRWEGKDNFEFQRDTASPEYVLLGGLVAAALFMDGNATELVGKVLGAFGKK